MAWHEEVLTRIAAGDEGFVDEVLTMHPSNVAASGLDPRVQALVRLGAQIALDAAPPSYRRSAGAAMAAGATVDDVVGVLIAVAPIVGLARTVSAAPELARAIGYEVGPKTEHAG